MTRFVTETDENPPWTDCTWASAAMAIDFWTGGDIEVDRERLRAASGDMVGGSNFLDVDRAISRFLNMNMPAHSPARIHITFDQFWAIAQADKAGAMLQGISGAFSADYWRRWSPNFRGAHCAWGERFESDRFWWMDPLGRGTYRGEWMSKRELRRFMEGLTGPGEPVYVCIFHSPVPAREEPMIAIQRGTESPTLAVVKAGTKLLDGPGGAVVETLKAVRNMQYIGFPVGSDADWRMVVREEPMSSGGPALRGVYVPKTAVEKFIPNPAYESTKEKEQLANVRARLLDIERYLGSAG